MEEEIKEYVNESLAAFRADILKQINMTLIPALNEQSKKVFENFDSLARRLDDIERRLERIESKLTHVDKNIELFPQVFHTLEEDGQSIGHLQERVDKLDSKK